MEAGSFPGPGQGGQHKVSSTGSWDSGLQCSQDSDGKGGMIYRRKDRLIDLRFKYVRGLYCFRA